LGNLHYLSRVGYDRTLKKVAEELKKSVQLVGRWSLDFSWKSRVRGWDNYQDRITQAETLRQHVRARKSALKWLGACPNWQSAA
jgi:hypothetical protein